MPIRPIIETLFELSSHSLCLVDAMIFHLIGEHTTLVKEKGKEKRNK